MRADQTRVQAERAKEEAEQSKGELEARCQAADANQLACESKVHPGNDHSKMILDNVNYCKIFLIFVV